MVAQPLMATTPQETAVAPVPTVPTVPTDSSCSYFPVDRAPGVYHGRDAYMRNTFYRPRGKGEELMAYLPYLRSWRRAVGLTRDGLAGMANIHPATITRIENHPFEHPCHLGLVHRLAEVLGIPNHHLIIHEPPEELPANWALGHVIRVSEEDGELRFRLSHLSGYLNEDPEPGDTFWSVPQIPLAELARRSGIAIEELEALRRCEIGATMAQLQRIGAALGQSLMRLIN